MADDRDDLDDLLDANRASALEARFRQLEQEAEIERLRQHESGAPSPADKGAPTEPGVDPLAELKQAMDSDVPLPRYLLVVCPHCAAKNRLSLSKVRTLTPLCGACKRELAFGD